ncbi:SUMF1/EgtB/PvdO family nonheme iron enzyme [Archangium gephyra]|nr:SUMF1/EgtB/PvdO family nonheme iron enzyme [Archangium gephyra]
MRATFILILTLGLIPLSVSAGPKSSSKPPPKPASPVPEDRWMWLPGGAFTFGCEPRSACERARKKRGVRAKVDGFWMMRDRTSVSEYEACISAGQCTEPDTKFVGTWSRRASQPTLPVDYVDFEQASRFCAWAGGRLPTEKEWEYAADSGHDMNRGIDGAPGAGEWVIWSTKKNPGYEATRGGLPDLEPVYPSDYGDALRGHHSEELGFRCVQSTKPQSKSG